MQQNHSSRRIPGRSIRFVATFIPSAGAAVIMPVLYRQPVGELRNTRTNEPLFESEIQRNVVFGGFLIETFIVLLIVGRLMAATM